MDMEDDEELLDDEEEILVYVEFEDCADTSTFSNKQLHLDMIGLDTEHPIMQVNGRFFEGTYEDAVGTYMFFDKNDNPIADDPVFDTVSGLNYLTKTRKLLKMQRVFVKHRTEVFGDSEHGECVPNLKTLKEAGVPAKYQEEALDFWNEVRSSRMDALSAYLEKQRVREEKKSLGITLDSESDEDNPFAAYNPRNESLKANKSKNRKEEEQEMEKCTREKDQQKTHQSEKMDIDKKELDRTKENLNGGKGKPVMVCTNERMEVVEPECEKTKNSEEIGKSNDSLNSKKSKSITKLKSTDDLSKSENFENMPTTSKAQGNPGTKELQAKSSGVKVLAKKNKLTLPSRSLTKKRLKNKSSSMTEKQTKSLKQGKNSVRNEEEQTDVDNEERCKMGEQVIEKDVDLQYKIGETRELEENLKNRGNEECLNSQHTTGKQSAAEQTPRCNLDEKEVVIDQKTIDEKRKNYERQRKQEKNIENNDNLQSGRSEERDKNGEDEEEKDATMKMEKGKVPEIDITNDSKMEFEENEKKSRKQKRRKEKLREISERLKAIADNYKETRN